MGRLKRVLRSPAGPRRLGTATRISASLFRRLSACFGSAPGQGPKAAKFAVLSPGHAGFPNHAKRSEGSDSAPIRNTPVSPCVPLCAIFLREPRVYSLSPAKTNVERFVDDCAKTIFCRVIPIDRSRVGVFAATFERPLKSV